MFKFFRQKKEKTKSTSFYPIDLKGYGNISPNYKVVQNDFALIDCFHSLAELYIPISYLSKKIASIKFKIIEQKTQKEIVIPEIEQLIKYPNNLDTFEELIQKILSYKFVTGNSYLNAVSLPELNKVSKIICLPSQFVKIKLTDVSDYRLQDILYYIFENGSQRSEIIPANVLYLKDINLKQEQNYYQYGISRLLANKYNITSLNAAYSTRVSLYQHGAKHILTGAGNEFNMLTPDQAIEEQRRINNDFGLTENQYQLMITRFPMNVTTLSKSVSELQLNEMNLADFQKICSMFEVPTILLNDNIQSTYNNKEQAEKDFYKNVVIPQAKELYDNILWWLCDLLKINKKVESKLIIDNIDSLNENRNDLVTRTIAELQSGIISINEARKILNYENGNI